MQRTDAIVSGRNNITWIFRSCHSLLPAVKKIFPRQVSLEYCKLVVWNQWGRVNSVFSRTGMFLGYWGIMQNIILSTFRLLTSVVKVTLTHLLGLLIWPLESKANISHMEKIFRIQDSIIPAQRNTLNVNLQYFVWTSWCVYNDTERIDITKKSFPAKQKVKNFHHY